MNITPAERACGCIYKEVFSVPKSVYKNKHVASGSVAINDGLKIGGVSDSYLTANGLKFNWNGRNWSLITRFKIDVFNSTFQGIFSTRFGAGASNWITLGVYSTNNISVEVKLASPTTDHIVASPIAGKYYDVMITKNGRLLTYYVDGVLWGTRDITTGNIGNTTNDVRHGIWAGSAQILNGEIKHVILYDRVLPIDFAQAYTKNSLFDYEKDAVVNTYMRAEDISFKEVGSNILPDGDMEADNTSAWTSKNSGILSKELGSRTGGSGTRVLRIENGGASYAGATSASAIFTIGKYYRISGWFRGQGSGVMTPYLHAGGFETAYRSVNGSSDVWQYFTIVGRALATKIELGSFSGGSAGDWIEYDDVEIMEVVHCIKDHSGKGNDLRLGDGITSATYPTKRDRRGYSLDGGDYFIVLHNSSLNFSGGLMSGGLHGEFWNSNGGHSGGFLDKSENDPTSPGTTFKGWSFISTNTLPSLVRLRSITLGDGVGAGQVMSELSYLAGISKDGYYFFCINGSGNAPWFLSDFHRKKLIGTPQIFSGVYDNTAVNLYVCNLRQFSRILSGKVYGAQLFNTNLTELEATDLGLRSRIRGNIV